MTCARDDCRFPELPAPYDLALREAVAFVLSSFKAVGIVASGTIVRGDPDPASDIDLWVVHLEPFRQRVQKLFRDVPVEIFVNPPWTIETYFADDQASARPISAHMMATGHVVYAAHPIVDELRDRARSLIAQPPALTEEAVVRARYAAATRFEDATDMAARDPIAADMLLSRSLLEIMQFAFLKARRSVPRDKDLLAAFGLLAPHAAAKARTFFRTADAVERLRLANEIADEVLGVRGFFEWTSAPEVKNPPPDRSA